MSRCEIVPRGHPARRATGRAKGAAIAAWLATATSACGSAGARASNDAGPSDATTDSKRPDAPAAFEGSTAESGADVSAPCGESCDDSGCPPEGCAPPSVVVLASGQHTPIGIAVDDSNVYWMNLGSYSDPSGTYSGPQLMKCAKTGCGNAPTVLASGGWSGSTRLAVSGETIYWAVANLLLSCPTTGCMSAGPTKLWSSPLAPTDIAVGETTVYFGDSMTDSLMSCPTSGCGTKPTVLWPSSQSSNPPSVIAVEGPTVYFGTQGISVLSCGPAGCAPPLLVGGTPTAMAVDATNVYVGTRATASPAAIASCPQADCQTGVSLLTSDLSYCNGIAIDATNVYFTDLGTTNLDDGSVPSGTGNVSKCPLAGCTGKPTPVAGFVSFPQQIAVDATNVYWTDFGSGTDPHGSDDGRVIAVAK
jgi:hypothetical protein